MQSQNEDYLLIIGHQFRSGALAKARSSFEEKQQEELEKQYSNRIIRLEESQVGLTILLTFPILMHRRINIRIRMISDALSLLSSIRTSLY